MINHSLDCNFPCFSLYFEITSTFQMSLDLSVFIFINFLNILFCFCSLQILGICFAQNLRADIFAQKSKWSH